MRIRHPESPMFNNPRRVFSLLRILAAKEAGGTQSGRLLTCAGLLTAVPMVVLVAGIDLHFLISKSRHSQGHRWPRLINKWRWSRKKMKSPRWPCRIWTILRTRKRMKLAWTLPKINRISIKALRDCLNKRRWVGSRRVKQITTCRSWENLIKRCHQNRIWEARFIHNLHLQQFHRMQRGQVCSYLRHQMSPVFPT